MTIILYQNLSESNKVDKNLTNQINLVGNLRRSSSIIDPVFEIEKTYIDVPSFNYIYVVEWNKYYYVTNIVSLNTKLWQISCHVDVLMTYRNEIRQQYGIIARQENLYNLYLDDDKFLVNSQRMYVTKSFPNRVIAGNTDGAMSSILTVAGGATVGLE